MAASTHQQKGPSSTPWTAPKQIHISNPDFTAADARAQFRAVMIESGITPPETIEPTGDRPKRFSTNGRPKDDAGWYVYHEDGLPAGAFGDFRTGAEFGFCADIGRRLTPAEEAAHRQRLAEIKAARDAEKARSRSEAKAKANALLSAGKPCAPGNPYLIRKGITATLANGFSLDAPDVATILGYAPQSRGEALSGEILILPVTVDGELTTAELIDGAGRKSAILGGAKAGGCWIPAPIPSAAEVIAIGEGAATVLSVMRATLWPVVAALSSGNLAAIANQVRQQHPGAQIVILADLDKDTRRPDSNAAKAATAVGGYLAKPELTSEEGTDWNDAHAVHGLEAIRSALLGLVEQAPPEHPAITKAAALREAVELALTLPDPLSRALALAEVGGAHLGSKSPSAATAFIEQAERGARRVYPVAPSDISKLAATAEERGGAKLAPRAIVTHHTYADVALVSAAGGTGKTTHQLYEAVHILTGRQLYGLEIEATGPVIMITAEDPRPVILARLHRVIEAMEPALSPAELAAVDTGFIVWDVSNDLCRLADIDASGRIMPTGFADEIICAARSVHPALIVLDPIVSFGPGESRVNDIEQALIVEARRIVRALDCAVRFITHVSQNAARGGTLDQYASRGGTALADGARMVSVLAPWKPGDRDEPPVTLNATAGTSVLKLARPKLSYAPPQPLIWLARDGYGFHWAMSAPPQAPDAALKAGANQVEAFLVSELAANRRHTRTTLEQARPQMTGITRNGLRQALAELEVSRRVVERDLPKDQWVGGRKKYLHPAKSNPAADSGEVA